MLNKLRSFVKRYGLILPGDRVTVALSGGVFHNRTIALLLPEALARRGLVPLTHHALPPGDGGLSYGQAAWASHVLR